MRALIAALALVAGAIFVADQTAPAVEAAAPLCVARGYPSDCTIHDFDLDCALTSADVTVIVRAATGLPVVLPPGTSTDVNLSGHTSVADAMILQQFVTAYGTNGAFPVC